MEGSVSSRWTSSFTVTGLTTYLPPKGHIILPSGRRTWSWCPICQIPIGIGRAGSSLLKGRTECVVRKSGRRCHMAILTIHGLTSKNQVKNVSCPFTCFILTFLTLFFFFFNSFIFYCSYCVSQHNWRATGVYPTDSWNPLGSEEVPGFNQPWHLSFVLRRSWSVAQSLEVRRVLPST